MKNDMKIVYQDGKIIPTSTHEFKHGELTDVVNGINAYIVNVPNIPETVEEQHIYTCGRQSFTIKVTHDGVTFEHNEYQYLNDVVDVCIIELGTDWFLQFSNEYAAIIVLIPQRVKSV